MLLQLMNVILILGGVVKGIDFFLQLKGRKPFFLDMKSQLLYYQEKALMTVAHLMRALSNEPLIHRFIG